jgi:hypothetical protein
VPPHTPGFRPLKEPIEQAADDAAREIKPAANPAVVRLTEALAVSSNLRWHAYGCPFDGDIVGEETPNSANVVCTCVPQHSTPYVTREDLAALLASHAALTDRLARAEADGMRKAAKLICLQCRDNMAHWALIPTVHPRYGYCHPCASGEWRDAPCTAAAIHAALAAAPPPEGTL